MTGMTPAKAILDAPGQVPIWLGSVHLITIICSHYANTNWCWSVHW